MITAESPVRHLPLLLALHFAVELIPQVQLHAEVLSRSDAVRMVMERNPEVEAARNAWEGARAHARVDRALPDPEFEFEELPRVGLHDHGEHTIGVSQRVEFPLKWMHRFRAGRRQAEAARLALFETARLDLGHAGQEGLRPYRPAKVASPACPPGSRTGPGGPAPGNNPVRSRGCASTGCHAGKGRSREGNQSPDRGGKRPDRGKKPSSMRSWPARCKPRTR